MKVDGKILTEAFGTLHIQDDAIALGEQIKNAIDAKAKRIIFDFTRVYSENIMTILEDGEGMNENDFKEEWNTLGNSSKRENENLLGGKGIGRFALFRISKDIEIYAKKVGERGCYQNMLYDRITAYEDISQLQFKPRKIEDYEWQEVSEVEHGTFIRLNGVNKINLTLIQKEFENFNLPFKKEKIKIECKYPEEFSKRNFLDAKEAVRYAPFNLTAVFDEGSFKRCECSLRDPEGNVIKDKVIDSDSLNNYLKKNLYNEERDMDIEKECLTKIGRIYIEVNNFFFDNNYMKKVSTTTKSLQDNFLYAYQGINIYRNDVKLFGFGSNDFLKLAEERLKRAGENVDNKQTFGYVIIDKSSKNKLIEQTNRDGFVSNDYSKLLILILEKLLSVIGRFRKDNVPYIKVLETANDRENKKYIKINKEIKLAAKNRNTVYVEQEINKYIKKFLDTNIPLEEIEIKVDMENYQESALSTQTIKIDISWKKDNMIKYTTYAEVERPKASMKRDEAILWIDNETINGIKNTKLESLLNELLNLNVYRYPNSCAFLLRAVIEISFNLFIKKYQDTYQLRVYYCDTKEELLTKKGDQTTKTKDRVDAVMWILENKQVGILTLNKDKVIIDNIVKINFTIHKNNSFIIPENLLTFYKDIEQVLTFVLNDISK